MLLGCWGGWGGGTTCDTSQVSLPSTKLALKANGNPNTLTLSNALQVYNCCNIFMFVSCFSSSSSNNNFSVDQDTVTQLQRIR